jgi:hypothetical protein
MDQNGASSGWSAPATVQIVTASNGKVLVISENPLGTWYLGNSYSRRRQAQGFRAIGTQIGRVSLAACIVGAPTEPIRVSIRRSLTGGELGSAEILPSQISSTDPENPSWVQVPLSAAVNEGGYYFLVLEVSRYDSARYYRIGYDRDVYPYGMWYPDSGTTGRQDLDMVCTLTFF